MSMLPQVLAHQSGDGITIAHCPFCFAGGMRYLTRDGVKTFAETVGTTQWVLTADRNDRTGGRWVQAHIHEFGEQSLLKVTLRRNKREMVVEATPEHRWLVKANRRERPAQGRINRKGKPRNWRPTECAQGHPFTDEATRTKANGTRECLVCAKSATPVNGVSRATDTDVLTKDLTPGMRLSHLRPAGVGDLKPSEDGIRHGVVFGDGTATGKNAAMVTLWGEKDKQLLQYFPDRNYTNVRTPAGVPGISVTGGLKRWMKDVPDSESAEYLYGWLAGYFAADGSVSKAGQVQISSARLEHLEAVRDLSLRLGISTYGITKKMRQGFPGREPSALYTLQFLGSSLNEEFFLIGEHRDRWLSRSNDYERFGWTVVSVKEAGKVEPVYCAVVPGTHSFALDGNIWTGNCGSGQVLGRSDGNTECQFCSQAFMVRVQPMFSAFPQTIDGMPVDIPGMPPVAPPGMPPGGDPMDAEGPPEAAEGDDDGGAPPFGQGGDSGSDSADGPSGDDDSGGGPPFGKKESAYRTMSGQQLTRTSYVDYLAGQLRGGR